MIKKLVVALLILAMMGAMLVSCDISGFETLVDSYGDADAEDTTAKGEDSTKDDKVVEQLNGMTPYEVYTEFSEKLVQLSSNCTIIATSNVDSVIAVSGQSFISTTDIEIVGKTCGDNSYSKTTTTTSISGTGSTTTVMETWYVDGVLYMINDMGDGNVQKLKMTITKEQASTVVYGDKEEGEGTIIDIPESWFNDVSFEKQKDGNYIMNIDMSGSRMAQAIQRLGITTGELEISDIHYAFKVDKDGMIISSTGDYTMSLGGEEGGANYSASAVGAMETKYSDFGTTKDIEVPEDADSYVEVTYDEIFGNL